MGRGGRVRWGLRRYGWVVGVVLGRGGRVGKGADGMMGDGGDGGEGG